ncbi:MAG TPA: PqqD family protein [Rhodanobacteraceae bacterium]|nr:PqqD family protein [Rhodanobacteraceae bacterium]
MNEGAQLTTATLAKQLASSDYTITEMPDGTGVLLDLRQEVVMNFNATGMFIVASVTQGLEAAQIVRRVVERFDVDTDTATRDVDGFLDTLAAAMGVVLPPG